MLPEINDLCLTRDQGSTFAGLGEGHLDFGCELDIFVFC